MTLVERAVTICVTAWALVRPPIRDLKASAIFVASITAPVASGWSGCRGIGVVFYEPLAISA